MAKNDWICDTLELLILKGNILDKFDFGYDPTKNMVAILKKTISLAHSDLMNAISWPKMIRFVSNSRKISQTSSNLGKI